MENTVNVTIPVSERAAAALQNPGTRQAIADLIERVFQPVSTSSPLAEAFKALQAEAQAAGLTDADVDAELEAYNSERRTSG